MAPGTEPSVVLPYLLLGNLTVNENPHMARLLGITHIVNMARQIKPNLQLLLDRCIMYRHIQSEDCLRYDLRVHFEEAFEVIDHARNTCGRCLVHCKGGKSRSVAIVIAYLMSRYHMSLCCAYAYVKRCRPQTQMNPTFSYILHHYECELLMHRHVRIMHHSRVLNLYEVLTTKTCIPLDIMKTLNLFFQLIFRTS